MKGIVISCSQATSKKGNNYYNFILECDDLPFTVPAIGFNAHVVGDVVFFNYRVSPYNVSFSIAD